MVSREMISGKEFLHYIAGTFFLPPRLHVQSSGIDGYNQILL